MVPFQPETKAPVNEKLRIVAALAFGTFSAPLNNARAIMIIVTNAVFLSVFVITENQLAVVTI